MSEIQTTLGELAAAEVALRRVAEQNSMNQKTVYHVAKLCKLVSAETRHWHERRLELFKELGVERPTTAAEKAIHGPTLREIPASKLGDFQKRLVELNDVAVTVAWRPLRSCDLKSALPADIHDLGPLCELVEPEDDK